MVKLDKTICLCLPEPIAVDLMAEVYVVLFLVVVYGGLDVVLVCVREKYFQLLHEGIYG